MTLRAGNFDDLAGTYDSFRIGYAGDVYDALFELGFTPGARVLDIGSGTGLVAAELVARGCRVTGVDISEPMLAYARRRVPAAEFVHAEAESLPFDDDTFDDATSAQTFHWLDQTRALAELARVVRPGGEIAVWWKGLTRGDRVRQIRDDTARELGLEPPRDLLAKGFPGLANAPLEDKRLRVIPWLVTMRAGDYLGYERSRARARDAYGDLLPAYFAELERRLGDPEAELALSYVHYLYVARVPAKG
jgi:ubiquinone/menaquinone biosynthesis C-methylase UbiE